MPKEHKFLQFSYLSDQDAVKLDQAVEEGWTIVGMAPRASQTVVLLQRDWQGPAKTVEPEPASTVLAPGVVTEAVTES